MKNRSKRALIIFVKNPLPGRTKTRLAASVGNELALRMYGQLLDYTREVALGVAAERWLYYSDFVAEEDGWSSQDFYKELQAGQDLGERMETAFRRVLQQADCALIIGSDCPGLTPALVHTAFDALAAHEVVIGPSTDGGYYLLGMRKLQPTLFRQIEWSTEAVLPQTLDRAKEAGLSTYSLPALSDVDYLEDWLAYGWEVPN